MTSKIEWTDETWNPTRGCSRVSAGCDNCYAIREARRMDHPGGSYGGLTRIRDGRPDWSGVVRFVPEQLQKPLRWQKPRRVFVDSMSDLFHESLPDDVLDRVFEIMARCPQHTFQILTKRPENMLRWLEAPSRLAWPPDEWPLPNVWLGVSVEDQATADERIPLLLEVPAAKRFVSYEPALGPVDLSRFMWPSRAFALDWIIVGGESGPRARPFALEWARAVRDQCREAGVAFFLKQMGRWIREDALATDYGSPKFVSSWLLSDGRVFIPGVIGPRANERPTGAIAFSLHDKKGGDMTEWPSDLRVREMPT